MQSYIIITGGVPTTQANYALKLNDTAGSTIGYRWYFNDMSNNWNSTDMSFLTTSESVSPNVTIVSPTSGQIFSSSRVSFELITDEDSTCNYSVNAGAINSSMTANSTGTGHTNSATLGNGDYTINYYCADIFGNLNNTENVSFRVSVSSSPSVSSGGSGIFKPTRKQLEEGYEKILNKEQIIQINLSNGEIYTVGIKEVNRIEGKVIFGVDGKNYSIVENSFEKIALDNDGYYDLQISVVQVYETGYSKIEFKEIHEEIPAEGEEAVIGKVVENNENIVSDKYNIIYYVFGFVVLVLIVSIVFRKFKQKKER